MDPGLMAQIYLGLAGMCVVAVGLAFAYWPQRRARDVPPGE